ncbi:MAG TPA: hypothetical protein VFX11_03590 [Candidatus Kapabacteria bacterium]|nr:hypothetical protein [Candidatus Kapabacteria bacterium]
MNLVRSATLALTLLTTLSACAQNASTTTSTQSVTGSAATAVATPVAGSAPMTASDMKILADKIKADKRLLVAANMQLTDAEAKGFWPLYDAYQKELEAINVNLVKGIADYADASAKGPLSDAEAKNLVDNSLKVEASELELKRSYVPKLGKVLPAMKVARYLQIENKIRAVIRYELASKIPLVQ